MNERLLRSVGADVLLRTSIGLTILALLWEALRAVFDVPSILLPPLSEVGRELYRLLATGEGIDQIIASIRRVALAFIASTLFGTTLGIMIARSRILEASLGPVIEFIRYIPIVCLIPVSILWLGLSESQKIFVLVLGTFCQLAPMVEQAVRKIPSDVIDTYLALNRDGRHLTFRVLIPSAAPEIYDALRISLGITWTYLIVAEVVGASDGLGFVITQAQRYLQSDRLFAGMIIIGVIGVLSDGILRGARPRLFPWAGSDERAP